MSISPSVLLKADLPLPLFFRGKVRDTYNLGNRLLIVATDRISAFDVVLPAGIPSKGLSRQKAYELVQRNAMKAWKGNKNFLTLLKSDSEVTAALPAPELEPLFDEQYYLRYMDDIFGRLGLTEAQWKGGMAGPSEFAPRSI